MYAWFSALTRNVEEEQIVAYVEALQGREYDPRNGLQKVVQNGWVQAGGSITVGVAAGIIGSPVGGALLGGGIAGTFAESDLIEKEAKGEEITYGDITWAYVSTGVGAVGGPTVKATATTIAEQGGIKVTEHIVIDGASEAGSELIYASVEENYNNER